jgi:ABC-type phosphate/phosphonate transport system substrate-binding protein
MTAAEMSSQLQKIQEKIIGKTRQPKNQGGFMQSQPCQKNFQSPCILQRLVACVVVATCLYSTHAEAKKPKKIAAINTEYSLAINDGATTSSVAEILQLYEGLGNLISVNTQHKVQKFGYTNHDVFYKFVKETKPQILFIKTIDFAGKSIRDLGYTALAKIDTTYAAAFIVAGNAKGDQFKKLEDLAGQDILFPPEDTFTSKLALATLKARNIAYKKISHIGYQEAVLYTVGGGLYPNWGVSGGSFQLVGAVNPGMTKQWEAKKGRILEKTLPMPSWCILVSAEVPTAEREALQKALTNMSEDEVKRSLEPLKIKKMIPANNEEYLKVLQFVGG